MTDDQPQPAQIQVNFDDVLGRFTAESATYLRRAVLAEAQVAALQQQVAVQRGMLESRDQSVGEAGTG